MELSLFPEIAAAAPLSLPPRSRARRAAAVAVADSCAQVVSEAKSAAKAKTTPARVAEPAPAPARTRRERQTRTRCFEPTTRHRGADPDTSAAAAGLVAGDPDALTEKQQKVFAALREFGDDGATDEQLTASCARLYGWRTIASTARTRRAELAELGMVEQTGERRPLASGLPGRVWRVVPGLTAADIPVLPASGGDDQ